MSERYTVRYGHLKDPSRLSVGAVVKWGDELGVMGSTGQSTGAHVHIDVTVGGHAEAFKMSDIFSGSKPADFEQLAFFIDDELGKGPMRVTTYPYDYRYIIAGRWKAHPGYDIVLDTPLKKIYWNRSMPGTVIRNAFDSGYGNHLHITFEA